MNKNHAPISIRWRLLWSLGLSLPVLWVIFSVIAALPLYREISNDEDENLRQIALTLLSEDKALLPYFSDEDAAWFAQAVNSDAPDDDEFFAEIDTLMQSAGLAFAIWDNTGQLLDSSEPDTVFLYQSQQKGFIDSDKRWHSDAWRIYYYTQASNGETVAVGQRWRERLLTMKNIVIGQLSLLLLSLPLLLGVVVWSVTRGLRPLKQLTTSLHQRHAHDLAAVNERVPKELQPLTTALNQLFARVSVTIAREQRFTADAAHELRSPLAAIKVQANELTHNLPTFDNTGASNEAHAVLQRIHRAADRASHLIDQLLTLAQLDNDKQTMNSPENSTAINWLSVSEAALQSVSLSAREKRIALRRHIIADSEDQVLPLNGDVTLLTLLLRNLLDNAIRYSVDGDNNVVELTLANDHITVRDHGRGIDPEHLNRVHERFFRPAGQSEIGSGLGLSIVERIAELHGLGFSLDNHVDGGVVAVIHATASCKIV